MTSEIVTDELPEWLRQLATQARDLDPTQLSRFLPPADGSGRQSAVLMVFADTDRGPSVLLIERAADMRQHAGQVAFPGGSLDPGDASADAAALREASEEVGLDPASVRVLADLPAVFIPVTQFVVTPVLAWWQHPHEVRVVDPAEVAGVALVPIAELADPANRFCVQHPSGIVGPGFSAAGLFVWGFTAGLLDRLLTFGGWAQPWDQDVLRPLPPLP
ncbi:NUDIX hydrolase [uncultured Jatrophihabitans sp.]|uniref:NUDIX hydrolase n=1 Tax=uncultured Jatrophihabitans sp. TaxID=1610747 RepID=UPI0035C9A237